MSAIIDFHSHILPDVDDGSAYLEESLAMLRMEAEQGITRVIATPHFYAQHDKVESFLQRREKAANLLREAMSETHGLPQILVGAEVHFFRGISHTQVLSELTIGENQCILIEMPHSAWTDSMYEELEHIYVKYGITPIIAHIERYIGRFRTFGIPKRLAELPVLVQANASFFVSRSKGAQALRMLKKEQIHLLGSDCHDLHSRKPNLGAAVDRIGAQLGQAQLEKIVQFQNLVLDKSL